MVAVETILPLAELPTEKPWPEPTDQCTLVFIPRGTNCDWVKNADAWLAPPLEQPEAMPPVLIKSETETIQWRPGQAVIQARKDRSEDILAALTDFAFYEGELRALESAVEKHEDQAREDVPRAHTIRQADRRHWKRFTQMIEYFAQLRLTYARLEPRLARPARTLSVEARRLLARLLVKAEVETRLEALNDRLEAMEDLYEGANDRVADYRWYRKGHLLEIAILLVLMLEAILMLGDVYVHYRDAHSPPAATQSAEDLSEEFRAVLTRVAPDQITFTRSGDGVEQTLPLVPAVQVYHGKVNRLTKEVEATATIPNGLHNELFTTMNDKGLRVTLVTDPANKKIAEIYVMPASKKTAQ